MAIDPRLLRTSMGTAPQQMQPFNAGAHTAGFAGAPAGAQRPRTPEEVLWGGAATQAPPGQVRLAGQAQDFNYRTAGQGLDNAYGEYIRDPNGGLPLNANFAGQKGYSRFQTAEGSPDQMIQFGSGAGLASQYANEVQLSPLASGSAAQRQLAGDVQGSIAAGLGAGPRMLHEAVTGNTLQQQTRAQQLQQGLGMAQAAGQGRNQRQAGLESLLMAGAVGNGPSAAQAQFQGNLDQIIAAQRSASAGVRGGSAAAASRNAGVAGVQAGLQAQTQATQLRAQEQQAAQQALGNVLAQGRQQDLARAGQFNDVLGGVRGQDIGALGTYGGLALGARSADDARLLQSLGYGVDLLGLGQQGVSINNQGILGGGELTTNYLLGAQQNRIANESNDFDLAKTLIGGGLQAGGDVLASQVGKK